MILSFLMYIMKLLSDKEETTLYSHRSYKMMSFSSAYMLWSFFFSIYHKPLSMFKESL